MGFLENVLEKSEKVLIKSVRVCPKCGSRDVTYILSGSKRVYGGNGICSSICLTCGFRSNTFPETPLKEALKISLKPRKFDSSGLPISIEKPSKPKKRA